MRASGRNEHAATRTGPDDSISVRGLPVLPTFLGTPDRLERQEVELSCQDVEELLRAVMAVRPHIETRRNHHLEAGHDGAVRRGDLEGDLLRLGDQLPALTGRDDEAAHAIRILAVRTKSRSMFLGTSAVQLPTAISAVMPGPKPATIPVAPGIRVFSSNSLRSASSTTAPAILPYSGKVAQLCRNILRSTSRSLPRSSRIRGPPAWTT